MREAGGNARLKCEAESPLSTMQGSRHDLKALGVDRRCLDCDGLVLFMQDVEVLKW